MHGEQNAHNDKKEHEKSDAIHKYGTEPMGLSCALELCNIYWIRDHMVRVFEDCQGVLVLLVNTYEQRAPTGSETRSQIGWNTTRRQQVADLRAFSCIAKGT